MTVTVANRPAIRIQLFAALTALLVELALLACAAFGTMASYRAVQERWPNVVPGRVFAYTFCFLAIVSLAVALDVNKKLTAIWSNATGSNSMSPKPGSTGKSVWQVLFLFLGACGSGTLAVSGYFTGTVQTFSKRCTDDCDISIAANPGLYWKSEAGWILMAGLFGAMFLWTATKIWHERRTTKRDVE